MQFSASDLAQPPSLQRSAFQLQPDAVLAIADEFASLLKDVQRTELGPENTRQLINVLDAFEQLFVEMKATCDGVVTAPS